MTISTWEYHLEPAAELTGERLNALGLEGWELVAFRPDDDQAIFKRPGPDFRERITIAQREQLEAREKDATGEA